MGREIKGGREIVTKSGKREKERVMRGDKGMWKRMTKRKEKRE